MLDGGGEILKKKEKKKKPHLVRGSSHAYFNTGAQRSTIGYGMEIWCAHSR
jgi:hypothetical protein